MPNFWRVNRKVSNFLWNYESMLGAVSDDNKDASQLSAPRIKIKKVHWQKQYQNLISKFPVSEVWSFTEIGYRESFQTSSK